MKIKNLTRFYNTFCRKIKIIKNKLTQYDYMRF